MLNFAGRLRPGGPPGVLVVLKSKQDRRIVFQSPSRFYVLRGNGFPFALPFNLSFVLWCFAADLTIILLTLSFPFLPLQSFLDPFFPLHLSHSPSLSPRSTGVQIVRSLRPSLGAMMISLNFMRAESGAVFNGKKIESRVVLHNWLTRENEQRQ